MTPEERENARELGLDYEPALVQQEWIETACALIKAADDAAHDSDYMLDSKGIGFEERDVETALGHKKMLAQVDAQYRQMPQIFINGQRVGGLAGLQAALKELGL
jgi:glutaredoxin 3